MQAGGARARLEARGELLEPRDPLGAPWLLSQAQFLVPVGLQTFVEQNQGVCSRPTRPSVLVSAFHPGSAGGRPAPHAHEPPAQLVPESGPAQQMPCFPRACGGGQQAQPPPTGTPPSTHTQCSSCSWSLRMSHTGECALTPALTEAARDVCTSVPCWAQHPPSKAPCSPSGH